jgi:hypothetical protein
MTKIAFLGLGRARYITEKVSNTEICHLLRNRDGPRSGRRPPVA